VGAIATFNFATWSTRFPELATVGPALATIYFNEASGFHDNTGNGPVQDPSQQTTLLNLLTAHICWLNAPRDASGNVAPAMGNPAPALVGRVSNAGEGSVNVAVANEYPQGTPQWFQQTRYGSAYWAMIAGYRTMRYRAGPRRITGPTTVFPYWPN